MTQAIQRWGLPASLERLPAGPEKVAEAARQFEALLLAHLLKAIREAGEDPDEEEGLTGSQTYLELAEQHLAQALAARGGFGIARLLQEDLGQGPVRFSTRPADNNGRSSLTRTRP